MRRRRRLLAGVLVFWTIRFAAQPQAAHRVWRIGVLIARTPPDRLEADPMGQFPVRLRELGYVEGQNLDIAWRYALGDYSRLAQLARELVDRPVDVLVTVGSDGIRAAKNATRTIPIVFNGGTDVVAQGFVNSLAHPGGNMTGLTILYGDSIGKELEFLTRIVAVRRVAVLLNPSNESSSLQAKSFRSAAAAAGVEILFLEARTTEEIERAIGRAVQDRAGALIWGMDAFLDARRSRIALLAASNRLPSIGMALEYPEAGGLLGYGPDRRAIWSRVAEYVDRILKGANPGDLPIEQPRKLDFVINKSAAKSLGLTIPPELLIQADRVIE